MRRLFGAIGVLLSLFFGRLAPVGGAIGWWALLVYLGVFAALAVLWAAIVPFTTFYKVATGWWPAGYVAVFSGAILAAVALLPLLWTRSARVIVFTHLAVGLALLIVPWHNALEYLPLFLMAILAYAVGVSLTGMRFGSMRFWTGMMLTVAIVLLAAFFIPRTFAAIGGKLQLSDASFADIVEGRAAPVPSVASTPPAADTGKIIEREIPLGGPGVRVSVDRFPSWRWKLDQRAAKGVLEVWLSDGTKMELGPESKLITSKTNYPTAIRGEGTAFLWLCPPPSQACE